MTQQKLYMHNTQYITQKYRLKQQKSTSIIVLIAISISYTIISCGFPPPRNTKQVSLLPYLKNMIEKYNNVQDDEAEKNKLFYSYQTMPFILHTQKNDKIIFLQETFQPQTHTLFYSTNNGYYTLYRDLYFTVADTISLFSFDGQTWYPFNKKDTYNKHRNIILINYFKPILNAQKNTLTVHYSASMQYNENKLEAYRHALSRTIIPAEKNNVIALTHGLADNNYFNTQSAQKKAITVDFNRYGIHFKKGTLLVYSPKLQGNLLVTTQTKNKTTLTMLHDLYFYRPSKLHVAFSFDGTSWNHTIKSFTYARTTKVEIIRPNIIRYSSISLLSHKDI